MFATAVADRTSPAPTDANMRWLVCFLLFLATTINYMDRSVLSLIEPLMHNLAFMGWNHTRDAAHQVVFNNNYKHIVQCFQLAYGIGLLTAGRLIDKLGTKVGYALAIIVWALSSMSHALVVSVAGFCLARFLLGLGESGNFPAAIKAITEWFPTEERGLATGLFNSGTNVSYFVAPALVVWATGRFGWQAGFLATGSLGVLWLILWLLFPYDRLRRRIRPDNATITQQNLEATSSSGLTGWPFYRHLLRNRGLYAFSSAKFLTDPIWYFYLFYLPKFLNETYGLDLKHAYWEIVCVYVVSSFGSILGGGLSGWRMQRGRSINSGRKFALLIMAIGVVPIVFVPQLGHLFPTNAWPAVLVISLAAAAHQGWSANLFSTPSDMFPSRSVSTVVGIGGAMGSLGGVLFTGLVGSYFSLHPILIFGIAACAYLSALAVFQLLVPRLGVTGEI
ncbi:MAG: MFS transporter [Janthinobacterium lividum]